jgi:hypothetical protein
VFFDGSKFTRLARRPAARQAVQSRHTVVVVT